MRSVHLPFFRSEMREVRSDMRRVDHRFRSEKWDA